jgi:cell division protein FtsQ
MARARKQAATEELPEQLSVDGDPSSGDVKTSARRHAKGSGTSDSAPRRRLLSWLVFAFFLVVFVAAVALAIQFETFLATDTRFRLAAIEQNGALLADGPVEVVGLHHLEHGEIIRHFEKDTDRSLYLLPLARRREDLLAIDWVADARVTRLWPNRVRVYVREREPVALVALPASRRGDALDIKLIDANGHVMRKPAEANFDLPLVFGLTDEQPIELRASRVELLQRLQGEVESLQARFSELDVSNPANLQATMVFNGRNVTLLLGNEKYLSRVQNFIENYDAVMKANPRANLFDMRMEDKILATRKGLSGA